MVDTRSGITYKEIMPGTDLRYMLESKAVYEYITVSTPEFIRDYYEFELCSEGLKPVMAEDSGISFISEGKEQLYMPPAYMIDGNGEVCTGVAAELYEEDGRYILRYSPDRKWIEAPERAWTVAIDPTIYEYRNINNTRDTVVYSNYPNCNYQLAYRPTPPQEQSWTSTPLPLTETANRSERQHRQ